MVPLAVPFLLASIATTPLVARYGRSVIGVGAGIQLVGLATLMISSLTWWPNLTVLEFAPGLALMGLGQGLMMSPLMRVVLSDVPVESAGAGSGVLTTTQQTSLALGVATIGSAYLSLSPIGRLGPLHALVAVLAVQGVVALFLIIGSRGLPGVHI